MEFYPDAHGVLHNRYWTQLRGDLLLADLGLYIYIDATRSETHMAI